MNRRLRRLNEQEFERTKKVRIKKNTYKVLKELEDESKNTLGQKT